MQYLKDNPTAVFTPTGVLRTVVDPQKRKTDTRSGAEGIFSSLNLIMKRLSA